MNFTFAVLLISCGLLVGFLCHKLVSHLKLRQSRKKAQEIIEEAKKEYTGKGAAIQAEEQQAEVEEFRQDLKDKICKLDKRNQLLEERIDELSKRLKNRRELASNINKQVGESKNRVEKLTTRKQEKQSLVFSRLEKKADVDKNRVLKNIRDDLVSRAELSANESAKRYKKKIENHCDRFARRILRRVLPRCDIPSPATVSSAALKFPDQDAYNRFRDFYNEHQEKLIETINSDIRFEPEKQLAVIENMEPVQKEIAYRTANNIIQQKKFDFELVKSGVNKYTHRVKQEQHEAAKKSIQKCGLKSVPDKLLKLLGVLQFRTSYGQPQLLHSEEVAKLSALLAAETGADPQLACRAGLLHDVGKAVDRQRESGHAEISGKLAAEAGENEIVQNALRSHHGDHKPNSAESLIVAAADAISGGRPGARKENITDYSERIENLRELAQERPGVRKVYAMNAGRELRIWVDDQRISDEEMSELARRVARDIEKNLTYSGEIKVNTIREKKIIRTAYT